MNLCAWGLAFAATMTGCLVAGYLIGGWIYRRRR